MSGKIESETIKTYPNKWKKEPKHPDIRGTKEVVYEDGEIIEYDYAVWKNNKTGSMKVQIKRKRPRDNSDQSEPRAPGNNQKPQPQEQKQPPKVNNDIQDNLEL
jgi:hypothetical protein